MLVCLPQGLSRPCSTTPLRRRCIHTSSRRPTPLHGACYTLRRERTPLYLIGVRREGYVGRYSRRPGCSACFAACMRCEYILADQAPYTLEYGVCVRGWCVRTVARVRVAHPRRFALWAMSRCLETALVAWRPWCAAVCETRRRRHARPVCCGGENPPLLLEPYYREQHPHDYSCEYEVIKLGIRRLGDGGVRGRVANRGREDTTGGDGEE